MRHLNWLIGSLLLGTSFCAGCDDPPVSEITSNFGNVPDPGGLIQGVVQYIGPRPLCTFDAGKPTKLRGVGAVLTLYNFDDPPPPDGPLPTSILVVPMSAFFTDLGDCMPENPTLADLHVNVTTSAPFNWPRIPLGRGLSAREYRIEALFDRDGDYYPLFLTNNIQTAGDALGGAITSFFDIDPDTNRPRNQRIRFDGVCEHVIGGGRENGQVVRGVTVSVALPVWTERPMFELKQNNPRGYLSSEQTVDLGEGEWGAAITSPGPGDPGGKRKLAYERLRKFAGLELSLITNDRAAADCVSPTMPKADGTDLCVGPLLKKLGIDYDLLDQKSYAWHLWPFSDALHPMSFAFGPPFEDGPAVAQGFLMSTRTPWSQPFIALTRQRSPEETAAAIPNVSLLGGVDKFVQEEHSVYFPTLPVTVLPSATITTAEIDDDNDNRNDCDINVFPAGNVATAFETGLTDCQELPTGDYTTLALTGVAGNLVYQKDERSQTGFSLAEPDENGDGVADPFSVPVTGQLWIHPNDLGNAEKYPPDPEIENIPVLKSQGQSASFKVRDPNPGNEPRPLLPNAEQTVDTPDCDFAVAPPATAPRPIAFAPIPDKCCPLEIKALCDVPLCTDAEGGTRGPVRLNARIANGKVSPTDFSPEELLALEQQALTFEEARVIEETKKTPKTVIFEGLFREAAADEPAHVIMPRKDFKGPETRTWLSYQEYLNPVDDGIVSDDYPDCDELRKAGSSDTPAQESERVRLRLLQLDPSCIPFHMPAGCCN